MRTEKILYASALMYVCASLFGVSVISLAEENFHSLSELREEYGSEALPTDKEIYGDAEVRSLFFTTNRMIIYPTEQRLDLDLLGSTATISGRRKLAIGYSLSVSEVTALQKILKEDNHLGLGPMRPLYPDYAIEFFSRELTYTLNISSVTKSVNFSHTLPPNGEVSHMLYTRPVSLSVQAWSTVEKLISKSKGKK